ncbi:DUF6520 family protein [Sinomicrobium sp. M5D2P9]
MKIKKFLLGGFVLVFAIGSAIASAFVPEIAHVRGKTSVNPDVWSCVPTNVSCDTEGQFPCVVRIPVSGVNTNVLGYQGPGFVSPESSCSPSLKLPTQTVLTAIPQVTILEVRPTDRR